MKAWVLKNINDFQLENVTDVSDVKVKACGICGSDIPRVYRDGAHNMPLIIGHEFAGECLSNKKRVGVFPLIPCMKCEQCKEKHYEMCINYDYLGSRSNGGFAEYVNVPEWNMIELPDNVSYEQAAMLEPMAVAVHAIRRVNPKKDESVAVIGLGTIGLLVCMFLKEMGIENIKAVGNKDYQKKFADELEVEYTDKASDISADVVFECVGKNETYLQAVDIANPMGRICLVGNPASDMNLDKKLYWKILRKQLTLTGTWNSSFTHEEDDDWHYVLKKLSEGKIHPEKLITHRFSIGEIDKGFEIMRDKKEAFVKVMMVE